MQKSNPDQVVLSGISKASELPKNTLIFSRPKPKAGWQNQDCVRVDLLEKEIDSADLKKAYQTAAKETAVLSGGSTGTTLVVTPSKIHVAWLGDSPAFLVGVNPDSGLIEEVKGLNEPHTALYEREQIEAKGGRVEEGRLAMPGAEETSLSMSRSFGDSWLGNLLNRDPEIMTIERASLPANLVWYGVVASDGVISDSEYNLLFPRPDGSRIIDHVAKLFRTLLTEPWSGQQNWAEHITQTAQQELQKLHDKTPEPRRFDDAVVDDTSMAIVPISSNESHTYVATVTDGHRDGGEIVANQVIHIIHDYLNHG